MNTSSSLSDTLNNVLGSATTRAKPGGLLGFLQNQTQLIPELADVPPGGQAPPAPPPRPRPPTLPAPPVDVRPVLLPPNPTPAQLQAWLTAMHNGAPGYTVAGIAHLYGTGPKPNASTFQTLPGQTFGQLQNMLDNATAIVHNMNANTLLQEQQHQALATGQTVDQIQAQSGERPGVRPITRPVGRPGQPGVVIDPPSGSVVGQSTPASQVTTSVNRPVQARPAQPTGASPAGNTARPLIGPIGSAALNEAPNLLSAAAQVAQTLNNIATTMDLQLVATNTMGFSNLQAALAHATELGFYEPRPQQPWHTFDYDSYLLQTQVNAIQQMAQYYAAQGVYNIQTYINQNTKPPSLGPPSRPPLFPSLKDPPPFMAPTPRPPLPPVESPPFSEINQNLSNAMEGKSVGIATEQMIETGGPLLVVPPNQHEAKIDDKILDGIQSSLAEQKLPMTVQGLARINKTNTPTTVTSTRADPSAAVPPSPVPPTIPPPPGPPPP